MVPGQCHPGAALSGCTQQGAGLAQCHPSFTHTTPIPTGIPASPWLQSKGPGRHRSCTAQALPSTGVPPLAAKRRAKQKNGMKWDACNVRLQKTKRKHSVTTSLLCLCLHLPPADKSQHCLPGLSSLCRQQPRCCPGEAARECRGHLSDSSERLVSLWVTRGLFAHFVVKARAFPAVCGCAAVLPL